MNNYIAISSLAMDLKRAALGFYKGSFDTALRFQEEALKRSNEVDIKIVKPHIKKLLLKLPEILKDPDKKHLAEDLLMHSQILQNYALTIKKQ